MAKATDGLSIGLWGPEKLRAMVDSRLWWVFPGYHPVIGAIEERFSKEREKDFPSILGTGRGGMFYVTLGKKSSVSKAQLTKFLNAKGAQIPQDLDEHDILLMDEDCYADAALMIQALEEVSLES